MQLNEIVSGWMTDNPLTLSPDRPVIEAYDLLSRHAIHHLPITEGGRLVGLISDRDLHRVVARKAGRIEGLFKTPVSEVMTRGPLVTVGPLATLGEAAKALMDAHVNSLPVLDGDRLVGIITSRDLLRALVERPVPAEAAAL